MQDEKPRRLTTVHFTLKAETYESDKIFHTQCENYLCNNTHISIHMYIHTLCMFIVVCIEL